MRTISIFRHKLQKVQTGSLSPESLNHSRLTHGAINIPQSTIYFFGDSKLVYYKQFRSEHKITWTGARKSPKVRSIPPYITCNNANERLHFLKLHQYIVNIKTCTLKQSLTCSVHAQLHTLLRLSGIFYYLFILIREELKSMHNWKY